MTKRKLIDMFKNKIFPKQAEENRLKADMVAMLEKKQLEIEELDPFGDEWSDSLDACNDIIQHKIDALNTKVESEGDNRYDT